MLRKPKTQPRLKGRGCTWRPRSAQGTEGWARRAGGSGRRDQPPGHHARPCPRVPTMAAAWLTWMPFSCRFRYRVLTGMLAGTSASSLLVQITRLAWLLQEQAAGQGGRRGAPSGSGCHGHAAPAGPQGRGEEPEEQQGPMGPGHPTGRQWGAQGAAGARHPQCSCSAWAPGGCGMGEEKKRLSEGRDCPLQKPSSSPESRQLSAATATQGSGPKGARPPQVPGDEGPTGRGRQTAGAGPQLTISVLGRLYAHFPEQKTESRGRGCANRWRQQPRLKTWLLV